MHTSLHIIAALVAMPLESVIEAKTRDIAVCESMCVWHEPSSRPGCQTVQPRTTAPPSRETTLLLWCSETELRHALESNFHPLVLPLLSGRLARPSGSGRLESWTGQDGCSRALLHACSAASWLVIKSTLACPERRSRGGRASECACIGGC
jgi:hypothetical protein